MEGTMKRLLAAAIGLPLILSAIPAQADWVTSWTAAPLPPTPGTGQFATPSWTNRTIRQTLKLSAGGSALRVRLTNAFGAGPLKIGAARVALLDDSGKEVPGSAHMLTFAGADSASIAKGAPLISDTIKMAVPALARISLDLYLPEATGPCTCHQTGLDTGLVSPEGNFVGKPFTEEAKIQSRPFVAGVEVDAAKGAATVAIIGDSISDGIGSTNGANRRWPDFLAARLAARKGNVWGVANQGISGNRVINDGAGEAAVTRLDRDILAMPGVKAIIVFEGVNDIGVGFGPARPPAANRPALPPSTPITAQDVINGYRQIIARAHAKGIKVYGATIAPYKGAIYWSEAGEAARQQINAFIRSSKEFDAVLDFDAVIRDPKDPASMRADYHMGDHLHGNDASYKAAADSIDLKLFP
jgi:lysophospholipase L1-like esterase